jgi:hypothetical protein
MQRIGPPSIHDHNRLNSFAADHLCARARCIPSKISYIGPNFWTIGASLVVRFRLVDHHDRGSRCTVGL